MATGLGSVLGGVIGGAAGTALPGLGTATGFAAGSAIGGGIEGLLQKKKAMGMEVQTMSPLEATYLDNIRSKQRALEAGVMYQPQQQAIQQTGVTGMRAATRVAGGDAGGTISALQKMQRGAGRSLNELYGQMMSQSTQMMGMEGQAIQPIAQRQFMQSQWEKSQQLVDAVQKEKDAKQIIAAVIAKNLAGKGADDETIQKIIDKIFAERFGSQLKGGAVSPDIISSTLLEQDETFV